jgi:hypothetical protein
LIRLFKSLNASTTPATTTTAPTSNDAVIEPPCPPIATRTVEHKAIVLPRPTGAHGQRAPAERSTCGDRVGVFLAVERQRSPQHASVCSRKRCPIGRQRHAVSESVTVCRDDLLQEAPELAPEEAATRMLKRHRTVLPQIGEPEIVDRRQRERLARLLDALRRSRCYSGSRSIGGRGLTADDTDDADFRGSDLRESASSV